MTCLYDAPGPGHHASQITHCQSDGPVTITITTLSGGHNTWPERERESERESMKASPASGGIWAHWEGTRGLRTHACFLVHVVENTQKILKYFDFRDKYVGKADIYYCKTINFKIGMPINLVYSRCSNCGKIDTVIDHQKQLFAL